MKGTGLDRHTQEHGGCRRDTTAAHSSKVIGKATEDASNTITIRTGTARGIFASAIGTEIKTETVIEIATRTNSGEVTVRKAPMK